MVFLINTYLLKNVEINNIFAFFLYVFNTNLLFKNINNIDIIKKGDLYD